MKKGCTFILDKESCISNEIRLKYIYNDDYKIII